MVAADYLERVLESLIEEIGDQENDGPMAQQLAHVVQSGREIGAAPGRLERQQVTDEAQSVFAPLLRRYELLDPIRE